MKTHLSTALFLDALRSMGRPPCPRPKGNDYFLISVCFSLRVSIPVSTSKSDSAETDAKPEVRVSVRSTGHTTGRPRFCRAPGSGSSVMAGSAAPLHSAQKRSGRTKLLGAG